MRTGLCGVTCRDRVPPARRGIAIAGHVHADGSPARTPSAARAAYAARPAAAGQPAAAPTARGRATEAHLPRPEGDRATPRPGADAGSARELPGGPTSVQERRQATGTDPHA